MAEYKTYSLSQLESCKNDHAAWYWLAHAYMENRKLDSAAEWFRKTWNDSSNEWAGKSGLQLGIVYIMKQDKDEALKVFEETLNRNPNSPMTKLNIGFLYAEGTPSNPRNLSKAIPLVESTISFLISEDGNDNYLKANECFKIGEMYRNSGNASKALEYFKKTVARCDTQYASDRSMKEWAEANIQRGGAMKCLTCGGSMSIPDEGGLWCDNSSCRDYRKVKF